MNILFSAQTPQTSYNPPPPELDCAYGRHVCHHTSPVGVIASVEDGDFSASFVESRQDEEFDTDPTICTCSQKSAWIPQTANTIYN